MSSSLKPLFAAFHPFSSPFTQNFQLSFLHVILYPCEHLFIFMHAHFIGQIPMRREKHAGFFAFWDCVTWFNIIYSHLICYFKINFSPSFFMRGEHYSILYIYWIFSIHSSMDRQLIWYVLYLMNMILKEWVYRICIHTFIHIYTHI